MSTITRYRALTGTVGGFLAAVALSSAPAYADVWSIGPGLNPTDTTTVLYVSGMPPYDQTLIESGTFGVTHYLVQDSGTVIITTNTHGVLNTTSEFGMTNQDLVEANHSVIDILNLGGGYENVYTDLVGAGTGGANDITDTVVTPFGNFDIPTTFDAAALDIGPTAAAATDWLEPGAFTSALEADWASLVALF